MTLYTGSTQVLAVIVSLTQEVVLTLSEELVLILLIAILKLFVRQ